MVKWHVPAAWLFIICMFWSDSEIYASSDLQQTIKQKYSKSSCLYIEFEQSIYWIVREKTSKNTGSIALAPGDKFRVELANDVYVSNGATCWQYSKNTHQVIVRNLKDLDRSTYPSYLLTTIIDNYRFTEKDRTKQQVTFAAAADSTTLPEYTAVTITVQPVSGTVTSLKLTDKNGNITTYQFKKTVFNKQHSQHQFEFEAPPDADIIDYRK
jgi:outer membrane lipoprotein-sorting protein